jgi:hypothetical protein
VNVLENVSVANYNPYYYAGSGCYANSNSPP